MKTWKAIILESNKEYEYNSDVALDMQGLNPKEEHIDLGALVHELKESKISKLAFLNRFTTTELVSFYTAVNSNVQMQILEKKLMAAQFIDLKRSDTILAVNVLVQLGMLTISRASEILNTEPTELEVYNG